MRTYPYAVIDGNQAPDISAPPWSCHLTFGAAKRAANALNRGDANAHYYVADWGASRNARLRPNDAHYPCDEWTAAACEA